MKQFNVEIERITLHSFVVTGVETEDEAAALAQDWLDEGEEGSTTITDESIVSVEEYEG